MWCNGRAVIATAPRQRRRAQASVAHWLCQCAAKSREHSPTPIFRPSHEKLLSVEIRVSLRILDSARSEAQNPANWQFRENSVKKVYSNAAEALDGLLHDGMFIAAGGFGLCGIPELLLDAIKDAGTKDLTFASNNAGVDDFGIGILLQTKQVKKMISSYVGENAEFMRQYLSGELELEFNPQGTLAERMRAGGAGIPGFYTKTGVGTVIAEGKEHKDFPTGPDGAMETYIMENGIFADLAIVKAWKADETGNLVFRKTARNFNVPAATCGKVCVVEVEEIVPTGSLDPDHIHLPGIYVHRIIKGEHEKRIEQRTVRQKETA